VNAPRTHACFIGAETAGYEGKRTGGGIHRANNQAAFRFKK
jgi:hypothetical protein